MRLIALGVMRTTAPKTDNPGPTFLRIFQRFLSGTRGRAFRGLFPMADPGEPEADPARRRAGNAAATPTSQFPEAVSNGGCGTDGRAAQFFVTSPAIFERRRFLSETRPSRVPITRSVADGDRARRWRGPAAAPETRRQRSLAMLATNAKLLFTSERNEFGAIYLRRL
jgi:hypothetical protein